MKVDMSLDKKTKFKMRALNYHSITMTEKLSGIDVEEMMSKIHLTSSTYIYVVNSISFQTFCTGI